MSVKKLKASVALLLLSVLVSVNVLAQSASLIVQKSVDQEVIAPGEQVVYTLNIANTGSTAATNIVVEDKLSPLLRFVSATAGGAPIASSQDTIVRWTFPRIEPGQSGSVSVITSADFASDGQSFGNVATINSDSTPLFTSNNKIVFVVAQANLEVSKSVSRTQVTTGETVMYTLEYRNTGGTDATNVVLSDVLDSGLEFVSASDNGSYDGPSRTVSWSDSEVPSGQTGAVTLVTKVGVVPDNSTIPNTATIFATGTGLISSEEVNLLVSNKAALEVILTSDTGPVEPGGVIQYTTTVTNTTAVIAENVVVTTNIPDNTGYLNNLGGGVYNSTDQVTWDFGNLGPGQAVSVGLLVRVGTPLANGTQISATSNASAVNTVTAGAVLLLFVSTEPVLTLTKSASATQVSPGDQLTYTLEYGNVGNDVAEQFVVRDYLPSSTTFVSANEGGTFSQGLITWNVGTVPPGGGGIVSLTVQIDSPLSNGTTLQNVAAAESLRSFPISAPTITTLVSSLPDLQLSKVASRTVAAAGDEITYTLAYQNTGTTLGRDVTITDILPPQTEFVRADKGGKEVTAGAVQWLFSQVQPAQSGTVSVTVRVASAIKNGTVLHNTASILSNGTSPSVAPIVDTVVNSAPDLSLTKSGTPDTVLPGEIISYTLSYQNTGSDSATAVVIRELVPENTIFVSASNGGVFDDLTNTVSWSPGAVPALSGSSVTMAVRVDSETAAGTTIANIAEISSTELASLVDQYAVVVGMPIVLPKDIPTLSLQWLMLLIAMIIALVAYGTSARSD